MLTCIPYLNQGLRVRAIVRVVSYSFVVRTEDGESMVISEANVPDGEHEISGHQDADRVDLSVRRRGPDGRFVASAQHSHSRES